MTHQETTRKLELNKACLEALTLYAHGLISLTELCTLLDGHGVTVSHVTTQFTDKCTLIQTGPKESDLYMHLTKLSGEKDERDFPIDDLTCIVNL